MKSGRTCLGLFLVALPLQVLGCGYRMHVESEPLGAAVSLNGEPVGVTPVDIRLAWRPLFLPPHQVRVALATHRAVTLSLPWESRLVGQLGQAVRSPSVALGVTTPLPRLVVLTPVHGGVGHLREEEPE